MGNVVVKKDSSRILQTSGVVPARPDTGTDVKIKIEPIPLFIIFLLGSMFYWYLLTWVDIVLKNIVNKGNTLTGTQTIVIAVSSIVLLYFIGRTIGLSFIDIEDRIF